LPISSGFASVFTHLSACPSKVPTLVTPPNHSDLDVITINHCNCADSFPFSALWALDFDFDFILHSYLTFEITQ